MPKRRENCFLGIHFDFHAMPDEVVASYFCPDVLSEMLDRIKPDFLQVDTKGHPGLSSYPTKSGTQAKEIKHDVLKFWREETRKRDIALYGHHSGLYDINVCSLHPDWSIKNADGTIDNEFVSPFSPYVDQILIPQLKELALDYELDGAWIDGECWGSLVDYSDYAQNAYYKKFKNHAPRPDDEDYEAYREFCREGFRKYIKHYVTEIKKIRPDFQITSNWIYSPYMSEKATVEVDFLSGDYSCANAVISGRHCGRYLAARNMTWDLMAWGQNAVPCTWQTANRSTKEENQYKQEASIIVALGGGFQFFNIGYCGGGYVQRWALPIWEKTAEFCHERQICHGAKPYSNIAVMVPYEVTPKNMRNLYSTWSKPALTSFNTWLSALCDIQLSPCVVFESELDSTDLSDYSLIVLPNNSSLLPDAKNVLEKFILNGGTVVTDIDSVGFFDEITKIKTSKRSEELKYLAYDGALAAFKADILNISGDLENYGELYSKNYLENDSKKIPSAFITPYGSGKIVSMNYDFTKAYSHNVTTVIKKWLRGLIDTLNIPCFVNVKGSSFIEVVTTKKNDDLLISLINLSGDHRLPNVRSYNEILPIYNINVSIDKKKDVFLEPGHIKLDSENINVQRLDIHSILVVKNYFK